MEHSFLLTALHPWILPEILLRITGSFLLLASAVCFTHHAWALCWLELGAARLSLALEKPEALHWPWLGSELAGQKSEQGRVPAVPMLAVTF